MVRGVPLWLTSSPSHKRERHLKSVPSLSNLFGGVCGGGFQWAVVRTIPLTLINEKGSPFSMYTRNFIFTKECNRLLQTLRGRNNSPFAGAPLRFIPKGFRFAPLLTLCLFYLSVLPTR